ncbi:MAG: hypothetical protein ACRDZ4_19975, partial [Egibacteraceae bacterium]
MEYSVIEHLVGSYLTADLVQPEPGARFGLRWGRRWIAALEALGAVYANRLPRGRTYARGGRVADLVVVPGQVTATVHGS